ncbi:hypothetical protein L1887_06272 [Cichorium endivia]|nr:hypothetical protein L1887_06272 [Cichorium endivia]
MSIQRCGKGTHSRLLLDYSINRRKADSATTSFLFPTSISVKSVSEKSSTNPESNKSSGPTKYISGTLPDSRHLDRIDNPQIEGYKFDPNGKLRIWLLEFLD